MNTKILDYASLCIVFIGALNWGLVGLLKFNLVNFLFGNFSWLERIIYVLVGLCGIYLLSFFSKIK